MNPAPMPSGKLFHPVLVPAIDFFSALAALENEAPNSPPSNPASPPTQQAQPVTDSAPEKKAE